MRDEKWHTIFECTKAGVKLEKLQKQLVIQQDHKPFSHKIH